MIDVKKLAELNFFKVSQDILDLFSKHGKVLLTVDDEGQLGFLVKTKRELTLDEKGECFDGLRKLLKHNTPLLKLFETPYKQMNLYDECHLLSLREQDPKSFKENVDNLLKNAKSFEQLFEESEKLKAKQDGEAKNTSDHSQLLQSDPKTFLIKAIELKDKVPEKEGKRANPPESIVDDRNRDNSKKI